MDASDSSGEEFGSGDLDSSSDDAWQQTRLRHAEAWVSPGRAELSERLLFAFVEPPVPMLEVSFFLRSALRALAPRLPVDLLPSSRGALLLRCESAADRDLLHRLGPVSHEGHMLHLQKPEETSNRFFRVPAWLAFVAVTDFPNEHWYAEKISQCFRSFSEVVEIDPECLTGENFGPLRLLLEVNDRLEIPLYLRISSKLGVGRAGAVAKILPIRVWPRQSQLDSQGNLARFFGPPAPPQHGPSLGPSLGPMSSTQQLRPTSNYFYCDLYPAGGSQRGTAAARLVFDPLRPCSAPVSGSAAASTAVPAARVLGLAFALARLLSAPRQSAVTPASPTVLAASPTRQGPAAGSSPKLITYRRRRLRLKSSAALPARPQPAPEPSRRTSSRLAAKANQHFVDMTAQVEFPGFIALICWEIWKARNAKVFRGESLTADQVLLLCKNAAAQWKHRLSRSKKQLADTWCSIFTMARQGQG